MKLRLSPLSPGVLQYCIPWCTQHREIRKGGSLSANSAFGVLSSMVPYQVALHIQLHSACLCQTWGGGRGSNPSSQPHVCKTFGSRFFCQEKCLVILQSCCPFPRISPAFGILDRPQQPQASSTSHKATSVGPDSVFPLFTAEQYYFSRVRALHICTESNRMWSACSDGVKLFEGVF